MHICSAYKLVYSMYLHTYMHVHALLQPVPLLSPTYPPVTDLLTYTYRQRTNKHTYIMHACMHTYILEAFNIMKLYFIFHRILVND